MEEIAKRIYDSIRKSGYSYGELSRITNIPKSALQRYATGETPKIPIDRVEKIASATNVSARYLMGWDEEEEEAVTPDEQMLLDLFRLVPEDQKDLVLSMIRAALGK